ncbi:MAG: helix-hairpin-helix domain-containing protein [Bacteroidota bacterium]
MNWLWDNVCLKKEERAGMFVFICILFVLLMIKWYLVAWYKPNSDEWSCERFAEIEYMIWNDEGNRKKVSQSSGITTEIDTEPISKRKSQTSNYTQKESRVSIFEFDPNRISYDSLLLLGLKSYAAKNMIKYREKGGRFKTPDDLKRVYGLERSLFERIEPYVKIEESSKKKLEKIEEQKIATMPIAQERKKSKTPMLAPHSIDINLADTTELKKLKGIGSVYANRIVKFRRSLGGYFSIEQINQVWGISDSLYLSIKPFLKNSSPDIQKKNINELDKKSLSRHPYVDWKNAKTIMSYRKMHGDFESIDDLRQMHGLSEGFIDTLAYYFDVR